MNERVALPNDNRLAPLWREYWQERWHRVTSWEHLPDRQGAFLTATLAREGDHPIVADSPAGTHPFLGVLTLGKDSTPSVDAGVVHFPIPGHLLTIAPTRTGKGTCQIVPNLLLYAGSTVVIDVKGENADITAEHRSQMFPGAKVWKFAPFSDAGTARYNPMDFVRVNDNGTPNRNTFEDSRLLAEMLIPGKGTSDEFWDKEARTLLHALILYIACTCRPGDPGRTLASVVAALYRPPKGKDSGYTLTVADLMSTAEILDYAPLRALASTLVDHEEKVRAGVFSTCRAEMKIWLSERLQAATSQSDFQFSDLKASMCRPVSENPAPTTLYIIVPPEYLNVYRTLLRVMIGLAVVELTRPAAWADRQGWRSRPPGPVLFLLDELPALGPMSPIVEGLSYLAGYDVQLWSFAQNIGQLKEIYGESWQNFPANSGATSFFGVNDPQTAEYVERLLGETPERMVYYDHQTSSVTRDLSREPGQMTSTTIGTAQSHRFIKDKVMSAAEVRALSDELQLIFIRNRQPILASKLPFYKFELIEGLAGQWLLGASA